MENQLNQYMEKAFTFEERGCFEEAVQLCCKCIQAFPEYKDEIEFEIAKMNYRNGKAEEALQQFQILYEQSGDNNLIELILDAYYRVNLPEYMAQYQENCKQLGRYPYFYGQRVSEKMEEEIRFYPLLSGKHAVYYYDRKKEKIKTLEQLQIGHKKLDDCACAATDMLRMEDILWVEQQTRKKNGIMDNENPLMLVYQEGTWELFLQLIDVREMLAYDRIVLFDSWENLEKVLLQGKLSLPDFLICPGELDKMENFLLSVSDKKNRIMMEYTDNLSRYYEENKQAVIEHIEEGKPRILFLTCRYTTVLQYHVRDCMNAARKLGLKTRLLIEENRLSLGWHPVMVAQAIGEFKPDIVFVIDHFRFEYNLCEKLKQLVFIGWVQDPMDPIMSKESPAKMGARDIIMTHYTTWKDFQNIGYDTRSILDAPIPANPDIYRKYDLTLQEKQKYSCDICIVCHAADVERYLQGSIQILPEEHQNQLYEILKGYQKYVLSTGNFFQSEDECRQFLEGALWQHYRIKFSEIFLNNMAREMFLHYNEVLFREALAEWLLAAGYENIKLWGNEWVHIPQFTKYAMGPAENGEILSKIYQSSKIVIGNNFHATASARAWESMLSGAFYMSNDIPPDRDSVDIRKIMKADEELVIFHDREDFLNKVEYYLTHEEERERMAEIGHKAALERMTYDILMKRVIKELPERLKLLEQGEKTDG